jgi:CDP-diacylglycerol pyrophosphatase
MPLAGSEVSPTIRAVLYHSRAKNQDSFHVHIHCITHHVQVILNNRVTEVAFQYPSVIKLGNTNPRLGCEASFFVEMMTRYE